MAKQPPDIHSHWPQLIEGLQASPQEFYSRVESAIEARKIPDTKRVRVEWREGGPLSAKREYLRVRRKALVFDICGAPFGSGFFVSWWQGEFRMGFKGLLLSIPILGWIVARLFPITYYQMDTEAMFRAAIHAAVLDVIDEMTKAKGIRGLSEFERRPILGGPGQSPSRKAA